MRSRKLGRLKSKRVCAACGVVQKISSAKWLTPPQTERERDYVDFAKETDIYEDEKIWKLGPRIWLVQGPFILR